MVPRSDCISTLLAGDEDIVQDTHEDFGWNLENVRNEGVTIVAARAAGSNCGQYPLFAAGRANHIVAWQLDGMEKDT